MAVSKNNYLKICEHFLELVLVVGVYSLVNVDIL